ncbi:MAG: DUF4293 domain-containing protein [Saprospiraceae bacterium]
MIQRIQSIFLLLCSGSAFAAFLSPMEFFNVDKTKVTEAASTLADGDFDIYDNNAVLGLVIALGVFALISIFLFNNRKLQMSVTKLTIFLAILVATFIGVFFYMDSSAINLTTSIMPSFGIGMPILCLIFGVLAHRGINKDEKLVKSMDRLR